MIPCFIQVNYVRDLGLPLLSVEDKPNRINLS